MLRREEVVVLRQLPVDAASQLTRARGDGLCSVGISIATLAPLASWRIGGRSFAILCLGVIVAWGLGPGLARPAHGSPPSVEDLTKNLLALRRRYHLAGPAEKVGLLGELQSVAAARRERLAALLETDPGVLLRLAVPAAIRAVLPTQVQADVEKEVEIEGMLLVLHGDRNRGSRYLYFLEAGGQRYSLRFAADPPSLSLLTGSRVRVKGLRLGQSVVLSSGRTTPQNLAAPPTGALHTGPTARES